VIQPDAQEIKARAALFGCDGDHPSPPAPGNQSRRFPRRRPPGPPPLRGLRTTPITARAAIWRRSGSRTSA